MVAGKATDLITAFFWVGGTPLNKPQNAPIFLKVNLRRTGLWEHILESREFGRTVLGLVIDRFCSWLLAMKCLPGSLQIYGEKGRSLFSAGMKYNRRAPKKRTPRHHLLQLNVDWKSNKSKSFALLQNFDFHDLGPDSSHLKTI